MKKTIIIPLILAIVFAAMPFQVSAAERVDFIIRGATVVTMDAAGTIIEFLRPIPAIAWWPLSFGCTESDSPSAGIHPCVSTKKTLASPAAYEEAKALFSGQKGSGGGGYPPQGGGYGGGYPPQGGGYPPQGGGYPPQGGGYPPQGGGYPPQGGGYPPQQGGWQ